ncbi:hypothetical protein ABOM_002583 [Aspergillus bombycis]|uniref:F-box domain-containing protein n=1 Tax=Aspergillus bombycis TaxID=109264 RepID=A0A1F8A6S2_9EURO|nr:hypothetical protein ABOM_002583 [Aspergillus bombycis]OGM47397.1 hypothetical protein ABOM_002583 [Aspergillus bombycis]
MATARPAMHQTLSTPELLESILLQLDLRTLLTSAQRTCRTWRNLIKESPVLQRALFFMPRSGDSHGRKVPNPLLAEAFPFVFDTAMDGRVPAYRTGECLSTFRMAKYPETQAAFLRREASWRRMLVQQPPVFKLARWHSFLGAFGVYLYYEVPGDPRKTRDGLRMETLFEHIFFAPPLDLGLFEAPRMTWWGCNAADRSIVSHLESLGEFGVDADILISSCSSHGCEPPDVREEDQTGDARLGSQVWNGYHELGLRARCQEEEGWMGDVRQLPFQLDLEIDEDL